MNLREAIIGAGMTPPRHIPEGRFVRFPGAGKGSGNTAGWCRLITPTLAVFGDWSTGLTETWRDAGHIDTAESRRLLEQANQRERARRESERKRMVAVAHEAARIVASTVTGKHPYLARKGFPEKYGLIHEGRLVIPMRHIQSAELWTLQMIDAEGEKRFLTGGRAKECVYRFGSDRGRAWLCEGYATGLSLKAALERLPGPNQIIVCFSAGNLEHVAPAFQGGVVCADNDASGAGERAAKATGLPYAMPDEVGTDFNDMHQKHGIYAVIDRLRGL